MNVSQIYWKNKGNLPSFELPAFPIYSPHLSSQIPRFTAPTTLQSPLSQTIKFSSESRRIDLSPLQMDPRRKALPCASKKNRPAETISAKKSQSRNDQLYLGKRAFLSSALVCRKCKHKIRRELNAERLSKAEEAKSFLPKAALKETKKPENSVYKKSPDWAAHLYDSEPLACLDIRQAISLLSDEHTSKKLHEESPISRALVILFLKGELSPQKFALLSSTEQTLIKALLSVKNGSPPQSSTLKNKIAFAPIKRRTEENIKFIFNRAIKFMMDSFKAGPFAEARKQMKPRFQKLKLKEKLGYAFFGHYFGRESANLGTPIEQFLLPKKTRRFRRHSRSSFTSISKQYLQLVSVNPAFLCDLRFYLRFCFMKQMLVDTVKKVQIILEKTIRKENREGSAESPGAALRFEKTLRNTHMPWTIFELEFGLKDLKSYLRL